MQLLARWVESESPQGGWRNRKTILVVEDEAFVRESNAARE
jgi:hypothetical protein